MIFKLFSIIIISGILHILKLYNTKILILISILHFIDTINFDNPLIIYILTLLILIYQIILQNQKNKKND